MKLSIYLINSLLLFSIHSSLYACWHPGPGDLNYQYHFFQYEQHPHSIAKNYSKTIINNDIAKHANLKEWRNYFNNIPEIEHIEEIIYHSDLDKLETIKEFIITNKIGVKI